jgi:CMP-N-acetylneuraminic acid synthetase
VNEPQGILCVIPARGGSKGIPRKNLQPFLGAPLVSWTIRAALDSGRLARVVVSTDSEEIASVAREAGAEVPGLRPAELAEDHVHAFHVVEQVLAELAARDGFVPEAVMMLLPTSPLRTADDIRGAIDLFEQEAATAVISVVDLGKYMTNLRYLRGNRLVRVAPDEDPNAQRQGLEPLYGVNGSIFLARTAELGAAGTFHLDGALGYVMPPDRSVDVNSPEDLNLALHMARAGDGVDAHDAP